MNRWFQVQLYYATFGIRVEYGKVVEAAPIGRWMIGKDLAFIKRWIDSKGGLLIPVYGPEETHA